MILRSVYENIISESHLRQSHEFRFSWFTMKHFPIASMRKQEKGSLRQGGEDNISNEHYVIIYQV